MANLGPLTLNIGPAAMSLALCLFVGGCSSLPKGDVTLDLGIKDRGVASWYGKEFHGKLAANGEVFDMTAYTAAHRKLPLGSIVRVLNLDTGKSLQVRITDRGPYVWGRMLDLSYAAARDLGMEKAGTAGVHVEVVGDTSVFQPARLGPLPVRMPAMSQRASAAHPRVSENFERAAVPIRLLPKEAWYGRRQRLTASNGPHGSALPIIGPEWNDWPHGTPLPPEVRPFDLGRPIVNPWESRNPYLPPGMQQTPGYRSPQQSSLW